MCVCVCVNVREAEVLLRAEGYCGYVSDDCNDHEKNEIKKCYKLHRYELASGDGRLF